MATDAGLNADGDGGGRRERLQGIGWHGVSLKPWSFHSYPSPAASVTVVLATISAPLMGAGGGGRERGREGNGMYLSLFRVKKYYS